MIKATRIIQECQCRYSHVWSGPGLLYLRYHQAGMLAKAFEHIVIRLGLRPINFRSEIKVSSAVSNHMSHRDKEKLSNLPWLVLRHCFNLFTKNQKSL